ncbi:MAG: hypothetical protein DHS20C15_20080 [Planctomycetota bacterium]|nr:MAG: hypothetical protein DHS20C15_20080 [Planctomycetota bacterium]
MNAHTTTRLACFAAALMLPLATPAPAQTASLARDLGDGTRELLSIDSALGIPLQRLRNMVFQRPQLAGRARLHSLRADLPNLRGIGSAAPHVQLPEGGAVYLASQGTLDRVLLVDGQQLPRTLITSAQAGGALQTWLAASDDGRWLLIATSNDRVWLLDTRGPRSAHELTAASAPAAVAGESLRVSNDTAWMVAEGQVWRAELDALDRRFEVVSAALAPGESFCAELAVAGDGRSVAAVSETTPDARRLWHATRESALDLVLDDTADYDLPNLRDLDGPLLALSRDGSFLAWRSTVLVKEVFTRRIDSAQLPTQVTADANVADTFDGSSILDFTVNNELVLAVGETQADEPENFLDRGEFYALDLTQPGATLQNISQTSGETAPPYLIGGELELRHAFESPAGDRLLLEIDPDDGDEAYIALDLTGTNAIENLVPGGDQFIEVRPAGRSVLFVRQAFGGQPTRLDVLSPGQALRSVPLPPGVIALDRFAAATHDQQAACVARFSDGSEMPLHLSLVSATATPITGALDAVSEGLAFLPSGALLIGLGDPQLFAILGGPGNSLRLKLPPGDALPLQP